ncbi:hypothetical protein VaNZ11_003892 [Volvox africanus]|uniref:Sister chromatid cohesion protein n=1 Tax=Volvox africanus TaxID=51714 RepID=A0ABQ5RVA9_9CHLO|nr:hypothetical protein VaNZ11_003892 [Volvox africanus]
MAGPCFKLDLLSFDDPAILLPLPISAKICCVSLQQDGSDKLDEQMSQNLQLLEQLDTVLTGTDISYVRPVNLDVVNIPIPSSSLAKSLVNRNPSLFKYGVAVVEEDAPEAAVTTHGNPSVMAISAHNSQLDPPGASGRHGEGAVSGPDNLELGTTSGKFSVKKRARRAVREEVYVMRSDEAKAAAAKLSSFLESSIAAATGHVTASGSDDEDGQTRVGNAKGRGDLGNRQQLCSIVHLEVLKDLHAQLLTAQTQGYLHLVPHKLLRKLLLMLHGIAEAGLNQLLLDDTELKSPHLARVTTALEAMLCELVIYATPKLPPSLNMEKLLNCAVELTNYHLQSNVLALHDARFKGVYRQGGTEDEDDLVKSAKVLRARSTGGSTAGRGSSRWTAILAGQLEQALSLLAKVMSLIRMDVDRLFPLMRISQQTLAVASLRALHYRALGLVVSMFKYYPLHRETVMGKVTEELLSHPSTGKHVSRCFPLQALDSMTNIQMSSALVMQLIQVAAELPKVDTSHLDALVPAKMHMHWSDLFWHAVVAKLPSTRAAKTDMSADLKAWVEALVEDLLVALPLPEWPSAAVLLRRLICIVRKDRMASDAGMQLVWIELLGLVARGLYSLARDAEAPEAVRAVIAAVDAVIVAAGGEITENRLDKNEVAQELLLEHLSSNGGSSAGHDANNSADAWGLDASVAGSAKQLIACDMLLAHAKAVERQQGHKLNDKQTNDIVMCYRQIYERQRSCLGVSISGLCDLDRNTAVVLSRWLVAKSVLGCSRVTLLSWLAAAGGSGRTQKEAYAAAARAKSIKLLGGAIEVDMRVLYMPEVQVGIKGALNDDSILVREAALDLIGKHICRSADVAAQFYDVLASAAIDAGLTVRKRAVRLLWECCVRCPEFERRIEAMLLIVSRVTDTEDTMRSLINKICAEVWFLPNFQLESEEGSSNVSRGAEQRAANLGELVMAIYCRMGSAISIPVHSTTPIVVIIRNIVGEEGKSEYEAVRRGAREVVDVLLARSLELQGEQDAQPQPTTSGRPEGHGPAEELFRCLLALHVLCVADVTLLLRPEDPQRAIRCLAPYLKEMPPGPTDNASRRKAERLLAVLAIVGGCMTSLRHMDDKLADEIVQDLRSIVCRVSHVQAVTVACQCLCAMASLKPQHRNTVRMEASTCYNFLDNDLKKEVTAMPEKQRLYPRLLYTLGTLCRYGADILDNAPEGLKHPTCAAAMDLVLRFYKLLEDNIRAKDTALQALGFIFIARPQLAVNVHDVGPVLEAALDRTAPASIKARCLSSLTDLLRSEEDVLLARQAAARKEAELAMQATTLPDAENRALARRNGEGDSSSVSSGIIQMLWEKILALATDTTPAPASTTCGQTPPPTPSGTAAAHGAVVRRRALELIEVVIRGGIVVPWEALPALCALATDPERDTANRALAGLRAVVAANTAFVAGQVPRGVTEAYNFHCKLAVLERPGQSPAPDKCRPLVEGLSGVWTTIFQPDKALKAKFLTALLKPLDEGCSLASGTAAKSDPYLLSFMTYIIAELPYRKMDELLAVLVRINEIVSRRAEEVLARFQELREAARPAKAAAASGTHTSSSVPTASSTISSGNAPSGLPGVVKASVALSLLLLLKQYLRLSYEVTAERIAKYEPTGQQRKVEEKFAAAHNGKLRFNASKLRVDVAARASGFVAGPGTSAMAATAAAGLTAVAGTGAAGLVSVLEPGVEEVYKVLKTLMKQDEHDYKQGVESLAADAEAVGTSPGQKDDLRDVAINLEELMAVPEAAGCGAKKPPLASRRRGRGLRGRGGLESTSRGQPWLSSISGASTSTKRPSKRKRICSADEDSDDDDDGKSDSDLVVEVPHKARPAKRR